MKVMHLIYFLRYFLFLIGSNFVNERFSNPSQKITNKKIKTMEQILSTQKDFLTVREASQYTGYAESYLRKLAMRKQIPYYKISARAIRFSKADLVAFLSKCRVPSLSELQAAKG